MTMRIKAAVAALTVAALLSAGVSPASAQGGSAAASTAPEADDSIPVQPATPEEEAPGVSAGEEATRLDEVMVTANKRPESARTLAGAVTAIDKSRLRETGASSFGDYLSLSPGVTFNSGTPGYSSISIRGISTDTIPGLTQTSVGTYYDDIPLTDPGSTIVVPDIDAFDAERIEVLRGPQGALYGSASMGGAVNYIPTPPNLAASEFSVQGSGSFVHNSSAGGAGKLMFNRPLFADTSLGEYGMAVRGVSYYQVTPGTIDNLGTGQDQANTSKNGGGRLIFGWAPTGNSVLRLTGLYQKTTVEDAGYMDPSLGDLKKSTIEPEPSDNSVRIATLRYELEQDYGSWSFIGGLQDKRMHLMYDGTTALGASATGLKLPLTMVGEVSGYSTELRFASAPADRYNWLAGVAYADRKQDSTTELNAGLLQGATGIIGTLGQQLRGLGFLNSLADKVTLDRIRGLIQSLEAAAFIDGTFYITPDLRLSAGGRYYRNAVNADVISTGVLVLPNGSLQTQTQHNTSASGFNPKVSLAWQAAQRVLLYGLYSRGYRLGGVNLAISTPLSQTPFTYGPDEVSNYELGIKTAWLDGALTADLSAFWIDWKAIPLQFQDSTGLAKYLTNAGNARSKGLEGTVAVRPWSFLTLRSSLTWMDSRLLNDFDPNNNQPPAKAGDRLPGAAPFSASTSATGQWFVGDYLPSVSLIHRYVGESSSNLSFQNVKVGGYSLLDLRANVKRGNFGLSLYGKNLMDTRGVTASNNYSQVSGDTLSLQFVNPPRLVGIDLSYSFESE